jgi:hypothetical protein
MVALLSVFTTASAVQLHRDFDLVVGEGDFFDAADFHAGHFDAVADLQFLHGVNRALTR